MIPRVPPTSAVSPHPTSPLSVLILTSSASRTAESSRIETPIALGSLCSSAKVSTLVILSEEDLACGAATAAAVRGSAHNAAIPPPDAANPVTNKSLRDIEALGMISPLQDAMVSETRMHVRRTPARRRMRSASTGYGDKLSGSVPGSDRHSQ